MKTGRAFRVGRALIVISCYWFSLSTLYYLSSGEWGAATETGSVALSNGLALWVMRGAE